MADIFIGNVKGPQGNTGAQGQQGIQGEAATIAVGSVTTTTYGNPARVTNSGTSSEAVFDFVIPQGRPGEQVTKLDNLTIDAITEPSTQFPVPAVGDNGSTLFGKISKWFSDMTALVATKLNASNVVNNLTTTASGYALDARQGKALNDELANRALIGSDIQADVTWNSVGWHVTEIATPSMTGCTLVGCLLYASTYRMVGLTAQIGSSTITLSYYALNTSGTSGSIRVRPVYVRSN